jgi:hypothetical protein
VESPIRFGRFQREGTIGAVFGTALVACAGGIVFANAGIVERFDSQIRPVIQTLRFNPLDGRRPIRCWVTYDAPFSAFAPECRKGSIMLWGDSHAGRLYPGLSGDVGEFIRDSCPPLVREGTDPCSLSNRNVLNEIVQLKPRKLVLFAAWVLYSHVIVDPKVEDAFHAELKMLREHDIDVVLVGPAPLWTPDLPEIVYSYWKKSGDLPNRVSPAPYDYIKIDAVLKGIAQSEGARFISLFEALCNQDGCLTHTADVRSDLLSWDYGHLTTSGAKFAVKAVGLERLN